jgi:hypothetical protein
MNNSYPFRPFRKAPAPPSDEGVPIIGQPFKVKGGFATVMLQCTCEAAEPVLLLGGSPGKCTACGRMFVTHTFKFDMQTGQINVNVALVQERKPDDEPAGVPS